MNRIPRIFFILMLAFAGKCLAGESLTASAKYTDKAPVIDGLLADECWKDAPAIEGLQPSINGKYQADIDKSPTAIRLLWDAEYLYVSFSCRDDDIFVTGTVPHDGNIYSEDACEVFIDAKGDGRQWFEIQVNPLNQTLDLIHFFLGDTSDVTPTGRLSSKEVARDRWYFRSWEAEGLRTASGRIVEDGKVVGWTVEMAIPAASIMKRLGGGELKPGKIRANFVRYDYYPADKKGKRKSMFMSWAAVEYGCPHISPGAMGTVVLEEKKEPEPKE
ncbi:MAG: carbohydrate-binding family 9-like protein [Planctomycetes bacterium]|nr:carbohydrate-binding family 9-like protein [Planctomycetota bacterium]